MLTCECGLGYVTESGVWVSGDEVRNTTAPNKEEYEKQKQRANTNPVSLCFHDVRPRQLANISACFSLEFHRRPEFENLRAIAWQGWDRLTGDSSPLYLVPPSREQI